MSESSESYKSVTLKSHVDASPTELAEEMSSRSIHGDGVRVQFPSFADTGDAGEFSVTGHGSVFGITPSSRVANRGNDKSIRACIVSSSANRR